MGGERIALTKTLRDGRTATVTIAHHPVHGTSATLCIDGKQAANHLGPHHAAPKAALEAHPGYVCAIGPMLLTQDEADQVEAVYREVRDAAPKTDWTWSAARQSLVIALDSAEMAPGMRAAERMDSGDYANPFGTDAEHAEDERRTREAAEALAAFDAEHPEVAAMDAAERERAIQRALEGCD